MPELPEVETTKNGIAPHITGQVITGVCVRQKQLRWPIDALLGKHIMHQNIIAVSRRAKYLLVSFAHGTLICHLGMSGSLRIVSNHEPSTKHDHVDIALSNGRLLRYNDPRRFGAILWTQAAITEHPLLRSLGPEPLSDDFTAEYLYGAIHKKKTTIKQTIMDQRLVVGVGNIYACESLFVAGVLPTKPASKVTRAQCNRVVSAIKNILTQAIHQGGTTLRDFVNSDGKPGYFKQQLLVYGRKDQPCKKCHRILVEKRLQNRATVYCPKCQK